MEGMVLKNIKRFASSGPFMFRILIDPIKWQIVLYDLFGKTLPITNDYCHLQAAMDWLCYAQDITSDGGVSSGYSIAYGWQPSHRETTGYIIPTFFDYYYYSEEKEYFTRALRMADWELSVQLENGAIPFGAEVGNTKPLVFDTGQVIFGWVCTYRKTGNDSYKEAAERAANWLCEVQDEDGCWREFTFNGIPHTYNVRVAWALLELYKITEKSEYVDTAKRNIAWTLSNQLDNGWFKACTFLSDELPTTHTIAYTIRGILEGGVILNNQEYIEKVKRSADALLAAQKEDGSLSGVFDSGWNEVVGWSCLTGNAQISIIWLRLYQITNDKKYLSAATKAITYLKTQQDIKISNKGIRGAIKGSHPIWGDYNPFNYMNWMTKFFVDALLLEENIRNGKKVNF